MCNRRTPSMTRELVNQTARLSLPSSTAASGSRRTTLGECGMRILEWGMRRSECGMGNEEWRRADAGRRMTNG